MKNWINAHEKYIWYACVCGLFIVFGITRLWQLTTLPLGIHIDEAGMAYDAWCLANWGVDRHLKSWPVYLINFSSGQSSLYAFLCAILFRIFGDSMFIIRLPGVIFSFLTLVFGMKLTRRIYSESIYPALITGVLVVVSPFLIMGSRFGLDCNLMLGASTMFLYFFLTAIETKERWRYFVAGITGGIVLYSYVLSYIVLPIFLLVCLIYLFWTKKFSIWNWFIMAIPLGVLAFPLILVQIINYFDLPEIQLGIFTITKMPKYRISEIGGFTWNNFITALRSIFVGDDYLFDSIPGIWNMYAITAVLFTIGLISAIVNLCIKGKNRQYSSMIVPVCWFFAILLFSCFTIVRTYRVNGIFLAVALIATEGLWLLIRHLKRLMPVLSVVVCGIYVFCFLGFSMYYFGGGYTEDTYMKLNNFSVLITDGVEFIDENPELREKLTYVWERGIFYAVSAKPTPQEFDIVGDGAHQWRNYWFQSLPGISEEYNYMVPHGVYPEYCEQLIQAGFVEEVFDHYSVYYMK